MPSIPRPPGLDKVVRVGRNAGDIYDMCGYTDPNGYHPGDGIPRLLCYDGHWTLWYLVRRDDETVLANTSLDGIVPFKITEDVALALALVHIASCDECERVA
jgi:hypothetical protein